MPSATLRIVLLVSCAHMMVHVYELTFPAVEQLVGDELGVQEARIGYLNTAWRLPFGVGAVFAGLLADRFGTKRVLVAYLLGCGACSAALAFVPGYAAMMAVMLLMGSFASMYHPAGLALISRVTTPADRGEALGWHGVFGSAGIAGAPIVAGLLLTLLAAPRGPTASGDAASRWRDVYLILMVPGVLLGLILTLYLRDTSRHRKGGTARRVLAPAEPDPRTRDETAPSPPLPLTASPPLPLAPEDRTHLAPFVLLCAVASLFGFIYAGALAFLPRYLDGAREGWLAALPTATFGNYAAGFVLLVGMGGQMWAGKLAGRYSLERLLTLVLAANIPWLVAMGFFDGAARIAVTAGFAFTHFMLQPVSNSLTAKYVSYRRRSFGYGLTFLLSFGVGSAGGAVAGYVAQHFETTQPSGAGVPPVNGVAHVYPILAAVAALATVGALILERVSRGKDRGKGIRDEG